MTQGRSVSRGIGQLIMAAFLVFGASSAWGAAGIPAITLSEDGGTYSLSLQILIMMTLLTLLPAAFMTMTSFLRIIIVLALLRQAMGTMQTPSSQILIGLALFLTFFIMAPIFEQAYEESVVPLMAQDNSMHTPKRFRWRRQWSEPLGRFVVS